MTSLYAIHNIFSYVQLFHQVLSLIQLIQLLLHHTVLCLHVLYMDMAIRILHGIEKLINFLTIIKSKKYHHPELLQALSLFLMSLNKMWANIIVKCGPIT